MEQKVLVIEDDVEINELLGEYLGLEGFSYTSAFDGRTGVNKILQDHPDAVILDLMLPDIDGYEVCRKINAHRATAHIPVIMLTCMNQDCDRQKGLASGAFRYMNKPFLPDDLITKLKEAFAWRNNLLLRPPAGQIEISSEQPAATLQSINEMIADLFTRTSLPDASIVNVRDGFHHLVDWALNWGQQTHQNPRLLIRYRLITPPPAPPEFPLPAAPENAAQPGPRSAEAIEWYLTEVQPGILADTLFKPAVGGPALNTARNNGLADAAKVSPLAPWYQFLAKTGVSRFDKDTKAAKIRLLRNLQPELVADASAVPIVTIDGTRTPTRLRTEALAAKRK